MPHFLRSARGEIASRFQHSVNFLNRLVHRRCQRAHKLELRRLDAEEHDTTTTAFELFEQKRNWELVGSKKHVCGDVGIDRDGHLVFRLPFRSIENTNSRCTTETPQIASVEVFFSALKASKARWRFGLRALPIYG